MICVSISYVHILMLVISFPAIESMDTSIGCGCRANIRGVFCSRDHCQNFSPFSMVGSLPVQQFFLLAWELVLSWPWSANCTLLWWQISGCPHVFFGRCNWDRATCMRSHACLANWWDDQSQKSCLWSWANNRMAEVTVKRVKLGSKGQSVARGNWEHFCES